ncbi:Zn-ribbon domain-containing OB-fold protein [Micromonospora sp. STR1s_5]|nr:Zn-ribbon domain-containing OB-fold protein [Micromonospora sp. STR1s_5]
MTRAEFPAPTPTALTKPFWDGCQQGRLLVQRCRECGHRRFYPTAACPRCASSSDEWEEMSGKGKLYSWTVVHRSVDPSWASIVPFVSGIVELDGHAGLLLPGLVTDVVPSAVRADMELEVWFDRSGPIALPRWRPA